MTTYTKLVGIINITPDSFADSVGVNEIGLAIEHAGDLIHQGADLLDVGAESSNPKSMEVTLAEETTRLSLVIPELMRRYPKTVFSLDTRRHELARWFIGLGGTFINDYRGLVNDHMIPVIRETNCLYVVTHFPGESLDAVHRRTPKIDSVQQVVSELLARKAYLVSHGIRESQIVLDPGIGFGKTPVLNWRLLELQSDLPAERVMIAFSKKRFLGEGRLLPEVNQRAGEIAIESGCSYLRVHNPAWFKEMRDAHA